MAFAGRVIDQFYSVLAQCAEIPRVVATGSGIGSVGQLRCVYCHGLGTCGGGVWLTFARPTNLHLETVSRKWINARRAGESDALFSRNVCQPLYDGRNQRTTRRNLGALACLLS